MIFIRILGLWAFSLNSSRNSTICGCYGGGSGRFCGAIPAQGFIQEADDPGNDGRIR